MKKFIILIYSGFLALLFTLSCEKESCNPVVSGKLTENTDCKVFKSAEVNDTVTINQSCIEYQYDDSQQKLSLKHINAGFNCCPDKLSCTVKSSGDTIVVQESEKSALCDCNCLYDLDIEISGVHQAQYIIRFVEPYAGDQERIIFSIDLEKQSTGSFCVTRTKYPWGM